MKRVRGGRVVRKRSHRKLIRVHSRRKPGGTYQTVRVRAHFRRRKGEALCERCGFPDYRENPDCDH